MRKTLMLILFLLPVAAISQVTVTGVVKNGVNGKPVSGALVFLSNTTISARTTAKGGFSLKNINPGTYDLVIWRDGFSVYSRPVVVDSAALVLPAATISESKHPVTPLTEEDKLTRKKYLKLLKTEFLGSTAIAGESRFTNDTTLRLTYDGRTSTLTASSDGFLTIENDALGYSIKYFLKNFKLTTGLERIAEYSGFALFDKLKGTSVQERAWQTDRQEAYEGSEMHFLRSAVKGDLWGQGFKVLSLPENTERPSDSLINEKLKKFIALSNDKNYRDSLAYWVKKKNLPKTPGKVLPVALTAGDFVAASGENGMFRLFCNNCDLYVNYNKYHEVDTVALDKLLFASNQSNILISFKRSGVLFDRNGQLADPGDLQLRGVWSRKRVGDMLPLDFTPGNSKAIEPDSVLANELMGKLKGYRSAGTEKAYLHFDKPYYAAGDTIYFKAYVTDGAKHELSVSSGVLNVELISQENKIVRWIKLQLINGLAWGDFALPDTLTAGNYRVRAYTNLMRNSGSDYFFSRSIPIGSIAAIKIPESGGVGFAPAGSGDIQLNTSDVQFFPEGGAMLAGVKTKIAFKAVSPAGTGTEVTGMITDDKNLVVAKFASSYLGMGAFDFTPLSGGHYKAAISFADGSVKEVGLPAVSDTGCQLNIDNSDADVIHIRITSVGKDGPANVSLIGQAGGVIYFSAKTDGNAPFTATVSKKKFPTGIVQFTLFSHSGLPLNERLVFVDNKDQLKLNVSTPQTAYARRHQATVTIEAKTKDGRPSVGNFSVAVTDETKVHADDVNGQTILSNLLLTSDLRGYVEHPGYYFNNTSEKTNADLDLLMLTQGYHRFEWKKILTDSAAWRNYPAEMALSISGTLKKGRKALANQKVTIFAKAGGSFFKDTITDADGRFVFNNMIFADSTKFVVQAKVSRGQDNVTLTIDTPRVPPVGSAVKTSGAGIKSMNNISAEIDMSDYIQNAREMMLEQQKFGINRHPLLLKEVVINDKKKKNDFDDSQNLNGKGHADQVLTAKELETLACGRLVDCLATKLTNIVFKNGYMYVRKLSALDATSVIQFKDPMKIIIDGTMQQSEPDLLDNISPADVESVEVLDNMHSTAIYGSQGSAGLIVVTLKKGRKANDHYKYAPGVVTIMPVGFYPARTFYSPEYNYRKSYEKMADLRSTIYWNPTVVTGADGKASLSFYNADTKGSYRVIVEGIDAEGRLGRQVYQYSVD
ncbi:MAG TPA: carboxypeptidase regulatory-like domain-containing protein [Mucilaginibacter sp.]|nr:carboxypeptidase regulatory-like domain-containing protein [Mucilaginibacter sp.]